MRPIRLLLVIALASLPRTALAQAGVPLGPEFRVNTYTTNEQQRSSVASDSAGNFVVAWDSPEDGSQLGILAQRYSSSGIPVGAPFRVNTFTLGDQYFPQVAVDPAGNFLIVWSSAIQEGNPGVYGQRYSNSGSPLGAEFRVNTYTAGLENFASATFDSAGNFVVVWNGDHDGSSFGIFGQRYASSGAPLGPEFRVNTYTTSLQTGPRIAADSAGNFIVVWGSAAKTAFDFGVFGQRYASSGAPVGSEFRVNTYTTANQFAASITIDSVGNFVVVWDSAGPDGSYRGIFGQRFASSGVPLGTEFRVNTHTTHYQTYPWVVAEPSGNFVVAWQGYAQDGSLDGIFGQRYTASGAPLGPEFRVNTYTTNIQRRPTVTADASGNFLVVWDSQTQDGSSFGVFGQRYGPIVPVELMRFGVE